MAGYFGTETQRRLQARAEAGVDFIAVTPGACQTGRTMGADDPERLGWQRIDSFLGRDGVFGFRFIPASRVEPLTDRLAERACRLDAWDLFVAPAAEALEASGAVLARGLPPGFVELAVPNDPEGPEVRAMQALMDGAGLVPFSGSFLTGAMGPAVTVAVGDGAGEIVAVAHAYRPHNAYSPYHGYAWGGLVAVSEAARGRGLGTWVNARMLVRAVGELDASHVYQLVNASNTPSRRMVETCGLKQDTSLVCGIAIPNEAARFTR